LTYHVRVPALKIFSKLPIIYDKESKFYLNRL
jgi:hypothetical protein